MYCRSIVSIVLMMLTLYCHAQFVPRNILGLQLWLSADSGVVAHGDTVSEWKDRSGNNNNASQLEPTKQPAKEASITLLHDYSAIKYDGVDDFMNIKHLKNIRTVFWVIKEDSNASSNYRPLLGDSVTTDFHRGANKEFWFTGNTNPGILSGETRLNADLIDGSKVRVPTQYSIVSLITSEPTGAGNFSNDRINFGRVWQGSLVELIIYDTPILATQRQQVEHYLNTKYMPDVYFASDTIIQYGFCPLKLNAHKNWFTSYKWNTGETTDSIMINKDGSYSVSVKNLFEFTSSDTIHVKYPGNFKPFRDTAICYGSSIEWNTKLKKSHYIFNWQNNSTDSFFTITQPGRYYVVVTDTNGCKRYSDTINVSIDIFSQTASLGTDLTMCSGNSISLTSGAAQAIDYLWSTGEITSAIAIQNSGTYFVTVKNTYGCIAKDTINVYVKGINPKPDFVISPSCQKDKTFFTDKSIATLPSHLNRWIWNFGDASENSYLQNPTHTYSVSGSYSITLTVETDSGCSAVIKKQMSVNPIPNISFGIPSLICTGSIVQFTDKSSIISPSTLSDWMWNFGDVASQSNTSTLSNPTHLYSSAGTYSVQLIVGSSFGCKDTFVSLVSILVSPQVQFASSKVCKGNNTVFDDNSSGGVVSRTWSFGDGSSSSSIKNPTHKYLQEGIYKVLLSVTGSNGCFSKDSGVAEVYPLPLVGFIGDSTCQGIPILYKDTSRVSGSTINSWDWKFDSFGSSSLKDPSFTFPVPGTYYTRLTVISAQTCSAILIKPVVVLPKPKADFSFSPLNGAPPLNVSFNSSLTSGAIGYKWNFGDGGISTLNNPVHIYQDTGIYKVVLTAQSKFGCNDSLFGSIYIAYPFLDIAVTAISATPQNNMLPITVALYNAGTLDVTSMELSVYLDNGTPFHEVWTGLLKPHTLINYKFNSSFELKDNLHSVVCVEVKNVNKIEDNNLSNNRICTAITSEFTFLNPFPNPASDEIYLLFVSPDIIPVKLQLFDIRGREVAVVFDGNPLQGLNQIRYNTSSLNKGQYVIRLLFQGTTINRKFMKK